MAYEHQVQDSMPSLLTLYEHLVLHLPMLILMSGYAMQAVVMSTWWYMNFIITNRNFWSVDMYLIT